MEINESSDPGWNIRLDLSDAGSGTFASAFVNEAKPVCFIQVKSDLKCHGTGYVFVEYGQGEKPTPSGLAVTTSDVWVFCIEPGTFITIATEDLKAICNRVRDEHPERWNVRGGDNNNFGVIVSLRELCRLEESDPSRNDAR